MSSAKYRPRFERMGNIQSESYITEIFRNKPFLVVAKEIHHTICRMARLCDKKHTKIN